MTVAWVGFDQPTTLGRREYGGVAALPIWTNFMGNALKGTPAAWVHFDKNAKAPSNRNQPITVAEQTEGDRSSPPLALPLYRPAVVTPKRAPERDFDDLPDEEALVPNHAAPPTMQKNPTKPDALEHLIDQVQ